MVVFAARECQGVSLPPVEARNKGFRPFVVSRRVRRGHQPDLWLAARRPEELYRGVSGPTGGFPSSRSFGPAGGPPAQTRPCPAGPSWLPHGVHFPKTATHHLGLCHRSTEMGPRARVLALLPTAVAATKGQDLGKVVGLSAMGLIPLLIIVYTRYKYRKRSTTVTAPAGKAGLLFDATATPPTVTGLAALSPLRGEVQVGWRLAKVDDVDVSTMTGGEATRLLEARAANARRLTFDRTLAAPPGPPVGA